jgi:hypothetical protein
MNTKRNRTPGLRFVAAATSAIVLMAAGALRADHLDILLGQLKSARNEKAARAVEDRIRFAVKPGQTGRLLTELAKPHPKTAPVLLDLIATRADGPSTIPTLRKFLKPEPAWFAAGVLGTLARLGDPAALPLLTERADNGRLDAKDRVAYVGAIARLAVRGSDDYRPGALKALGRLRLKEGLGALLDGLTDASLENREAAMAGLRGTLGSLYPYLRFDYVALGYDPAGGDEATRSRKAESLRTWLPSLGIPKEVLKTLKQAAPPPTTKTPTGVTK